MCSRTELDQSETTGFLCVFLSVCRSVGLNLPPPPPLPSCSHNVYMLNNLLFLCLLPVRLSVCLSPVSQPSLESLCYTSPPPPPPPPVQQGIQTNNSSRHDCILIAEDDQSPCTPRMFLCVPPLWCVCAFRLFSSGSQKNSRFFSGSELF